MGVDAVSGGALDGHRTVTGTGTFNVDVLVRKADTDYPGYQFTLQWDPAVLAFNSLTQLKPAGLILCSSDSTASTLFSGCAVYPGTANFFTGPTDTITMHCVANGVSALHLQTLVENPGFGSTTMAVGGGNINTGLTDASVTCQGIEGITASPATAPDAGPLVRWVARLWDTLRRLAAWP
jgi:hypothetical protein